MESKLDVILVDLRIRSHRERDLLKKIIMNSRLCVVQLVNEYVTTLSDHSIK